MGHTGSPPTSNEELRDALIRHQIGLMQVSGRIRNQVWEALDETTEELLRQVDGVDDASAVLTPSQLARLRRIEDHVREIREPAWASIRETWTSGLLAIAVAEPEFVEMVAKRVLPVVADFEPPSRAELRALLRQPIQGRLLRTWARSLELTDRRRIMEQVTAGFVLGESTPAIQRRVLAVTGGTRNDAAMITRTAVNFVGNRARQAFYLENRSLFVAELYVATLDGRTSAICRSLDGETFPIGEGPTPPVHPNCRSTRVPAFDDDTLSVRPMKPTTERQLLNEYTSANGLARVGNRASLPRGHKGRFDAFSRQRVRELIGQVPAITTYEEFLRGQSAAFQDEVLGRTKGALFRRGGVTLKRFVDRAGNEKTIEELLRTEREAFDRAGLLQEA